jgi:hypothetical protein
MEWQTTAILFSGYWQSMAQDKNYYLHYLVLVEFRLFEILFQLQLLDLYYSYAKEEFLHDSKEFMNRLYSQKELANRLPGNLNQEQKERGY